MANEVQPPSYSWVSATIYTFNICAHLSIVALPKLFAEVGIILGSGLLLLVTVLSYVTCISILESLKIHELIVRPSKKRKQLENDQRYDQKRVSCVIPIEDSQHLQKITRIKVKSCIPHHNQGFTPEDQKDSIYVVNNTREKETEEIHDVKLKIDEKITSNEDGNLQAEVDFHLLIKNFLPKYGIIIFHISVFLSSFGVIASSLAAMSKSITAIICNDLYAFHRNASSECKTYGITIISTYRIVVASFFLLFLPFSFLHVTKSKIIQIVSNACKWVAWISMLVLLISKMVENEVKTPKYVAFDEVPVFLGISMYVYLAHLTLITVTIPIKNKEKRELSVKVAFILIFMIAAVISIAATLALSPDEIQDMVIMNFPKPLFLRYFLQVYPVLSCIGVVPIYISDLREKLNPFFSFKSDGKGIIKKIFVPLLSIVPSSVISFFVSDVGQIIAYTGVFFGGMIQFIIPPLLVYFARKKVKEVLGYNANVELPPAQHKIWLILPVIWYFVCVIAKVYVLTAPKM